MAGRINVKFLIILCVVLFTIAVGVVGMVYIAHQDPSRYLTRAKALEDEKNYIDAVDQYVRAYNKEKNPNEKIKTLMVIAQVQQKIVEDKLRAADDRVKQVTNCWREARKLNPLHEESTQKLLEFHYYRAKKLPQYLSSWTRLSEFADEVIDVNPEFELAYKYRGIAQVQRIGKIDVDKKTRDQALADLQKMVKKLPNDPTLNYNMALWYILDGTYLQRLGKTENAVTQFATARQLVDEFQASHTDIIQARLNTIQLLWNLARYENKPTLLDVARTELSEAEKLIKPETEPDTIMEVVTYLGALERDPVILKDKSRTTRGAQRGEKILAEALKTHPENLQLMFRLGSMLRQRGQLDDAITLFQKVAEEKPVQVRFDVFLIQSTQSSAIYQLAELNLASYAKETEPAAKAKYRAKLRQNIDEIELRSPGHNGITVLEGKLAFYDKKWREATKYLEEANKLQNNSNIELLTITAQAFLQLKETGAAMRYLEIIATSPRGSRLPMPRILLAQLKLQQNQLDQAEAHIDFVLRFDPALHPEVEYADAQKTALLKVIKQATLLKTEVLILRAYKIKVDDLKAGQKLIAKAGQILDTIKDNDDRSYVMKKIRLLAYSENYEAALQLMAPYYEKNPDDIKTLQQMVVLLNQLERKDEALALVEKARKSHPDQKLLDILALQLKGSGKQEIAKQVQEIIMAEDDPVMRELKLHAYCLQSGKVEQAQQHLANAEKLAPDNKNVLQIVFRQSLAQGEWDKAAAIIERTAKMNGGLGLDNAKGQFWRGELLLAQKKFAQAEVILDQAVKLVPSDSYGWMLLGDARRERKDNLGAETAYEKAMGLKPDSQLILRRMFVLADAKGDRVQALKYMEQLVRFSRGSQKVYSQYLFYLSEYGDKQMALARRLKLADSKPEDQANQRAIAILYMRLQQKDQSKKILEQLLAKDPDSIANNVAMAAYYLDTNDLKTGREMLRSYVLNKGDKATITDWVAYARFLKRANLNPDAAAAYRKAIALEEKDPEMSKTMPITRELADWNFRLMKVDQALELYEKLLARSTDKDPIIWRRYIDVLVKAKKYDQAYAQIKAFLATEGNQRDYQIAMLEGLIAEQQNRNDDAARAYDQAIQLAPNLPLVYIQRGRFRWLTKTQLTEVKRDFEKAKLLAPSMIRPRELLAEYYLANSNATSAINELIQLIEKQPRYKPARIKLVGLYLQRGNIKDAQILLNDTQRVMPDLPIWNELLAQVATKSGNPKEAVKQRRIAFELQESVITGVSYANALLQVGDARSAMVVIRKFPDHLPKSHLMQALQARAIAILGNKKAAIRGFNNAFDLAGDSEIRVLEVISNLQPVLNITEQEALYTSRLGNDATGRIELYLCQIRLNMSDKAKRQQAVEGLTSLHQRRSDDLKIMRSLAMAYQQVGRYGEARDIYLKFLEQSPRDITALNNLAYLLADNLNAPEDAIPYAKRALEVVGDHRVFRTNVLDTLGWVYYRAGQYPKATETLRISVDMMELPANRLHLAQVLFAQNFHNQAREQLKKAKVLAERSKDKTVLEEIRKLTLQLDASASVDAER